MSLRVKAIFPFIVLSLFLALGCGKKKEPQVSGEGRQLYIATRDGPVRSGPGREHATVAEIKRGTAINVVGKEGEWLKIVSRRGKPPGYIHERSARPVVEGKDKVDGKDKREESLYTTVADTYVREGPGLHYKVVSRIPRGMKVHIVGGEGEWLKVESKHGRPPGYLEKIYAERRAED